MLAQVLHSRSSVNRLAEASLTSSPVGSRKLILGLPWMGQRQAGVAFASILSCLF